MTIKIDIFSGFLGAGKTTLIKKLMEEKLKSEKLVIIENEFGEIGIDGSILKKANAQVKEINSGCICCTLVGDFGKAVEEVIGKYQPDRIIIEPSGVGKLSDVIKACEKVKVKEDLKINMVVTVVDALKFQVYIANFGEFYENQIKHAKTIILSRTQLQDGRKLESIAAALHKLNSKANIVTTPWEVLQAEDIISLAEQSAAASLENQVQALRKVIIKGNHHHKGCKCGCGGETKNHKADEVFEVWGIETPKVMEEQQLKSALNALTDETRFGMVLRGKGILQTPRGWLQFDYVPGELNIVGAAPDYTGKLCIIGSQLNKKELEKLFEIKR
ncbi:MAG: GTP-binding protein [Clostridia bacterium]|nr:GTP-binding protein [Clostridia bacterium]